MTRVARLLSLAAILEGAFLMSATLLASSLAIAAEPQAPSVGQVAPDFGLKTVDGQPVQLSALLKDGPVVVLVLRGYPGYQCPICSRQVGQYLAQASKFTAAGARIVMVYPGPSQELEARADEFIAGKTLPKHFALALDPDYVFTNAYKLRWDAKNETAYPATFVIGRDGKVLFAKISRTHGDRTTPDQVLGVLASP